VFIKTSKKQVLTFQLFIGIKQQSPNNYLTIQEHKNDVSVLKKYYMS